MGSMLIKGIVICISKFRNWLNYWHLNAPPLYIIITLLCTSYRGAERKYGFYAHKGYRQLFVSGYIIIYEVLDSEKIVAVLLSISR